MFTVKLSLFSLLAALLPLALSDKPPVLRQPRLFEEGRALRDEPNGKPFQALWDAVNANRVAIQAIDDGDTCPCYPDDLDTETAIDWDNISSISCINYFAYPLASYASVNIRFRNEIYPFILYIELPGFLCASYEGDTSTYPYPYMWRYTTDEDRMNDCKVKVLALIDAVTAHGYSCNVWS